MITHYEQSKPTVAAEMRLLVEPPIADQCFNRNGLTDTGKLEANTPAGKSTDSPTAINRDRQRIAMLFRRFNNRVVKGVAGEANDRGWQ